MTVETETANPNARKAEYGGKGGQKEGANPSEYEKKMRDMGKIPSGPSNAGPYKKIPPQYADKAKSPLRVTLKGGSNEYNPELKD